MTEIHPDQANNSQQKDSFKNGKIYFTKQAERKFFFILTLAMLVWGILTKIEMF